MASEGGGMRRSLPVPAYLFFLGKRDGKTKGFFCCCCLLTDATVATAVTAAADADAATVVVR